MSGEERQYKVGDEVWVKTQVIKGGEFAGQQTILHNVFPISRVQPNDVRTDADFVDPLDEAILEASELAASALDALPLRIPSDLPHEALQPLVAAVWKKRNAEKPRTAEDVAVEAISDRPFGSAARLAIAQAIVGDLHAAGLLKDDER